MTDTIFTLVTISLFCLVAAVAFDRPQVAKLKQIR